MHQAIGFARGVIVHSAIYGSDHRLFVACPGRLEGSKPLSWHRHCR
jgi:hypothetical protein